LKHGSAFIKSHAEELSSFLYRQRQDTAAFCQHKALKVVEYNMIDMIGKEFRLDAIDDAMPRWIRSTVEVFL
jgi:hypothetical protein